jgi:hypothetical protein
MYVLPLLHGHQCPGRPPFSHAAQGVKLRDVRVDGNWSEYLWQDPGLQHGRLRLETLYHDEGIKRMRPLELTGARGISFRWDWRLVAIGAHASDRDLSPYRFMTAPRARNMDIYVPLQDTETVDEVWMCHVRFEPYPTLKARPLPPPFRSLLFPKGDPELTRPHSSSPTAAAPSS